MNTRPRVWGESALLCALAGVCYVGFYFINRWIFSSLEHQHGVNWIFLPSGARIALVLVLGWRGALGIMLAIWMLEIHDNGLPSMQSPLGLINGVIGGWVPWFAKRWLRRHLQWEPELVRLTAQDLLKFTLLTCMGTSAMHQLNWFLFQKHNATFWIDVWPMFIGDVLGALLVLYGLKGLLILLRFHDPRDPI